MDINNALVVFQGNKIRRIWHNDEWYFSVSDIILVLTNSKDSKAYWRKLKEREPQIVTICHTLKLESSDGKKYATDCANTESMFRIIQSIPSKKAEPFKRWLAKIGYERVQEIENPELAQDRVKKYYELKGYQKDWIDKRLRGIAIRQELTDEWGSRKIDKKREFAILTNEISKATFNMTIPEYKEFKNINKKNKNLRDSMTDWELILTMIGEKATTDITISRNSQGFEKCKDSANEGGTIAKNTRKEVKSKIGKSLISKDNHIQLTKQKQIKHKKKIDI